MKNGTPKPTACQAVMNHSLPDLRFTVKALADDTRDVSQTLIGAKMTEVTWEDREHLEQAVKCLEEARALLVKVVA